MWQTLGRLALLAAGLTMTSCPQQTGAARPGGEVGALGVKPVPSASPTALGQGTDPSTTSQPAADPNAPNPEREGAPGSTIGTISCGKVRCKAMVEACGLDEAKNEWRCQKGADPADPPYRTPTEDLPFGCDDASDCPAGEFCCLEWQNTRWQGQKCVPAADANSSCQAQICSAESPTCPLGRHCVADAQARTDGTCEAERAFPTCKGKKKCSADAPVCLITKSGMKCAKEGAPEFDAASPGERFLCAHENDCNGGETCQTAFGETTTYATFCGNYHPGYRATQICNPQDFTFCGKDKECAKEYECAHLKGEPAWLGYFRRRER